MFLQAGAGDQDSSGDIRLAKPPFCGPGSLASLEVVRGIWTGLAMNAEAVQHVGCRQEIRKQTQSRRNHEYYYDCTGNRRAEDKAEGNLDGR
jgi:hypothetical protein